jgi:hypothetical protein
LEKYRQRTQKEGSAFEFMLGMQTGAPGNQESIVRASLGAVRVALYLWKTSRSDAEGHGQIKSLVGRQKRSALRHLIRGFLQIDELRLGLEAAQ